MTEVHIDEARIAIEKFNSTVKSATDLIKSTEERLISIGARTELEYLVRLSGEEIEHTPINDEKWMSDIEPPYDPDIFVFLGWNAFGKDKDNFRISYSEHLIEGPDTYATYCVPLVSINSKIRIKMAAYLDDFLEAAIERIKEEYEI